MDKRPGFAIEREPGTRTARLSGELDLAAFDDALEALSWAFEEPGSVDLDLSDLGFIDSTGIRLLVRLRKALPDQDDVVIRSPSSSVRKVLEAVGLDDLGFRIRP